MNKNVKDTTSKLTYLLMHVSIESISPSILAFNSSLS